jgi:hypothetical protein
MIASFSIGCRYFYHQYNRTRGRQLKKEQIPLLANIVKANVEEHQTLWLAGQIYAVVKYEKIANEAMQVADKKINPKNRKS